MVLRPKAPPDISLVNLDLLGREAGFVDGDPVGLQHVLCRTPHLGAVRRHERRAVSTARAGRSRNRASNRGPRRAFRPSRSRHRPTCAAPWRRSHRAASRAAAYICSLVFHSRSGPVSHSTGSTSSARLACQYWSAMTATPLSAPGLSPKPQVDFCGTGEPLVLARIHHHYRARTPGMRSTASGR